VEAAWLKRLANYYTELGVNPPAFPTSTPPPFGEEICGVVVELKPQVVSFHVGLPDKSLVDRLKAAGCLIFSSATTVAKRAGSRSTEWMQSLRKASRPVVTAACS